METEITHRRSRFNYWSPYFEAVYLRLIASGLRGNDGNEKWKQKQGQYCQDTKVICIFNKLQQ